MESGRSDSDGPVRVPAHPRALILWNPVAGREVHGREGRLFSHLPRDWTWEVREAVDSKQVIGWAAGARDDGFDLILAVGGDGTVGEAAEGIVRGGGSVPLALVPTGSANLLARSLGYPLDPVAAMRAVAGGRIARFDVGHVVEGDRYFLLALTAGLHAELMRAVPRAWKRTLGGAAYALAVLRKPLATRLAHVEIEGGMLAETRRTNLVLLLNFGDFLPPAEDVLSRRIRPDDGRLDLVVLHGSSVTRLVWAFVREMIFRQKESNLLEHHSLERLRLTADPPLMVQIDGEPFGTTPVTVEVRRRAIPFVVPDPSRRTRR